MKKLIPVICILFTCACTTKEFPVPEHFNHVDQVLWVVEDLDRVIAHWSKLGFEQVMNFDTVQATFNKSNIETPVRMAKANLGGAHVTWFQPLDEQSLIAKFHVGYGDGAMSLVHRFPSAEALAGELLRLSPLGVNLLEEITITTGNGELTYLLMDTEREGTYYLGYTVSEADKEIFAKLSSDNLHNVKINQYAFAVRDYEPVSEFWAKLGQPAFQINHPELGDMHYYGELTDHSLIQGWQRHGAVSYEWCIPVKPPIVYDDHIKKHGEGIHHLAFSVDDMDVVLDDYEAKGYVNSMGGTWGEKGKSGSGRYEYIDLEEAGGVTVELLWNYKE